MGAEDGTPRVNSTTAAASSGRPLILEEDDDEPVGNGQVHIMDKDLFPMSLRT